MPGRDLKPRRQALRLLLKNYRLSDDIAFRFSNRGWAEWPLSAEKFAKWVNQINGDGYLCNLFMDYETFGEHQWAETGIFQFLEQAPRGGLRRRPGPEPLQHRQPKRSRGSPRSATYDVHDFISWADTERDLTAWRGNAMQWNALEETYRLEHEIKTARRGNGQGRHRTRQARRMPPGTTGASSRRATTSTTCAPSTSPTATSTSTSTRTTRPYDSYINFMNVLDNLRTRLVASPATGKPAAPATTH
jgi:alpha-amylase